MEHIFETAGLGKAPFRFIGAYEQAHSSCDYCGTGIRLCCTVQDAEGNRFKVGRDCVAKTGDRGMVDNVKRELAKRTKGIELDRIGAARARLATDDALRATLAALPERYGTKLGWAEWMMSNAGHTGRMKVTRMIEKM